uniref:Hexosyltransferase n=1 Tax=Panagrellus redivivus TaxID=6233 RepID=A0A7E4VP84_PANRE
MRFDIFSIQPKCITSLFLALLLFTLHLNFAVVTLGVGDEKTVSFTGDMLYVHVENPKNRDSERYTICFKSYPNAVGEHCPLGYGSLYYYSWNGNPRATFRITRRGSLDRSNLKIEGGVVFNVDGSVTLKVTELPHGSIVKLSNANEIIPTTTTEKTSTVTVPESSEIAYHFIVGFTPDSTVRQSLKQENSKYGDIVFMDIVDDYNNLSLKTGALMQWQQKHCPNVNYLVKADDDIAVDLDRLLHFMRTDFDKTASVYNAAIFGLVWQRAEPNRDPESKWYVPHVAWRKHYYPDYCNGPMYVLTNTAVEGILQSLSKAHLMNIEDVLYTGIAAEIAGIARFNRRQIFGQGRSLDRYHACDSFGVPYVSSLYDFKLGPYYNPTMPNVISRAVESLHSVQCE